MSKKKLLATALLSVSLLGGTVVLADAKVTKTAVPSTAYVVDASTEQKKAEYTLNVKYTRITDAVKKDADGNVLRNKDGNPLYTPQYQATLIFSVKNVKADGKLGESEELPVGTVVSGNIGGVAYAKTITADDLKKVDNSGHVVSATESDATSSQFTVTLEPGVYLNNSVTTTAEVFADSGLADKDKKVKVELSVTPLSFEYKDGKLTVKRDSGLTNDSYVTVTSPSGAVSAYSFKNVAADLKAITFETGTLENGSVVRYYSSKERYDDEQKIKADPKFEGNPNKVDYSDAVYVVSTATPMYRVYNPNNGEHLYTTDENEYNVLSSLGWHAEGKAWSAPVGGTAVYRVYNPNNGDHHYTSSIEERDALVNAGWTNEGVVFYSNKVGHEVLPNSVDIYRLYNPNAKAAGSHHFTTDSKEAKALEALGWRFEGVSLYGVAK